MPNTLERITSVQHNISVFKQTLIFVAILTIPFLSIPFMMGFEEFSLNLGTIDKPKAQSGKSGVGKVLEIEQGIPVFIIDTKTAQSPTYNRSENGYFYGEKWNCTEFVRRYYYKKYAFTMPDDLNLAKSYFDPEIPEGAINPKPGLRQYKNGSDHKPMPGDLMVFTQGECGHIAVVSEVSNDSVEIVQQNAENDIAREKLTLIKGQGGWTVQGKHQPAAWLRIPSPERL